MRLMRFAAFALILTLLGAGCTDDAVASIHAVTDSAKTKAAEISAAIESAQKTVEKIQAIYDIIQSDSAEPTPSAPPSESQPQPATEESISSPLPSPAPDASTDQSL
jgi:hypothetical protein